MRARLRSLLLPGGAGPDAARLIAARGLRGFSDGMVSVLLASYLSDLGFTPGQIGILITGTLLGSASLTLTTGLLGQSLGPRRILFGASLLMLATAAGFLGVTSFWPLLVVAVAGTLNPSSGDVSVFLPTEQAMLSGTVEGGGRTALFARYNLAGIFCGALGALASGLPVVVAREQGWDLLDAHRAGFVVYGVVAVLVGLIYRGLSPSLDPPRRAKGPPLRESRSIVLGLAALFSLDSFGSGFVVQSLLALWLFERYGLAVETAGAIFFVSGLLSASSQLASVWLAARIGLIRTMVFTHMPANLLLIAAALMPSAPLAVACLLLRMLLAQMDGPARQSYVMAMVPPEERAAAASVTNVPRSLAAAVSPALGGVLLGWTSFGWTLIAAGLLKLAYDALLLHRFQGLRPPEEAAVARSA